MLQWTQNISFVLFLALLALTVYHSIRYRRERDAKKRRLFQALTNISMGLMLIIFAVSQNFYFTDSSLKRIFATVCLLLGLFNFYAGLRNYLAWKQKG